MAVARHALLGRAHMLVDPVRWQLQREVRAGSLEQVTLATGAYTVRVSNAQRSGFARLLVR